MHRKGNIVNFETFYEAGYRIMGLAYFFENEAGGPLAGSDQGGLTNFGKAAVQHMNDRNIIIGLAHASEQLFEQIIKFSTRPVVVSHTGVKGTYDSARNLSDDQRKTVAENGGMAGNIFERESAIGEVFIACLPNSIWRESLIDLRLFLLHDNAKPIYWLLLILFNAYYSAQ